MGGQAGRAWRPGLSRTRLAVGPLWPHPNEKRPTKGRGQRAVSNLAPADLLLCGQRPTLRRETGQKPRAWARRRTSVPRFSRSACNGVPGKEASSAKSQRTASSAS
jgi:hypothetical protein